MKSFARPLICAGLVAMFALVWTPAAFAQGTTTSSVVGTVTDPDGGALPGVTVSIVHEPTGTRYTAYTRGDGRFSVFNVRVGGPYSVSAELQGFAPLTRTELTVSLGEELSIEFALQLQAVEETITVTATSNPIINPARTGASSLVSEIAIETTPTLNREIADYARLDPYFSTTSSNNGSTSITVAGRNNRYNNIQIDGSVNNDLFGLAAQGTPGGQTETNPISMDAVQEINLVVSPYDVRQGGFSGGGINMVTRSGANDFHGSAFYYRKGDGMVGTIDDNEVGTFSDNNFGGRVGGRIVEDKVFFFASYEGVRRSTPSGWSINGSGQTFGAEAEATRFKAIMTDVWGQDPGSFDEFSRATDNDLLFGRIDANLNQDHQLTVRHNFVDGQNQVLRPSGTFYTWPNYVYNIDIKTNSFVTQLNSVFGDNKFNELRITAQSIKGPRFGPQRYPAVRVDLSDGRDFQSGTERFSTANNLDQTIFEITNDLTMNIGTDHTVVLGTHLEFFKFNNLFIRENFGSYRFDSLDDLELGRAQAYDYSFSNTSNPQQAAEFNAADLAFYAGDTWIVNDTFVLTYGLRVDIPTFPDSPAFNQEADDAFGVDTSQMPTGNILWSPRVGFNWDPDANGVQQVRGGIGIFTGRTPYVWLSNQYSNTGIEFSRISSFLSRPITDTNFIQYVADPDNQPTNIGNASTNEVDVTDPDFKFPTTTRFTLGYDRELPWQNFTFTTELIYSVIQQDVMWQNLNKVPDGGQFFDGRPTFETFNSDFRDVINMTNTQEGSQWNLLFKAQKRYANNWMASGSYAYGDSTAVNDGTSSQARSNWRFNNVRTDPNNPELGRSLFSVAHRVNFMFAYDIPAGPTSVRFSFFYDGFSGRPYSTTYDRDVNGDFESNDLMFVSSPDEVIITSGTQEDYASYIAGDNGLVNAVGTAIERNGSRAPWRNYTDMKIAWQVPIVSSDVEISLDIRNFLNLLNNEWGRVEYANFNELSPFRYSGIDADTGFPIYRCQFVCDNPDRKFTTDDLRSRWQMRFGARVNF